MEHLREHDEVEGLDISDALLALARRRLPGVPLHKRDLRSFDLGRRFDVVTCLFSAIGYAETRDGLRAATAALTAHIASKGLLLLEPWVPPADGMRFAEAVGPDPTLAVARAGAGAPLDGVFASETHYLVARPGCVEHFSESHVLGLFKLVDYEQALRSAGFAHEFLPEGAASSSPTGTRTRSRDIDFDALAGLMLVGVGVALIVLAMNGRSTVASP